MDPCPKCRGSMIKEEDEKVCLQCGNTIVLLPQNMVYDQKLKQWRHKLPKEYEGAPK